ncbi:MAG: prephenate dehydrogenase/arogenate dehydrogenase family protein [Verrucomicrobiota bacterium]|nr:prephenate dehydrogenase/arogenate dehydrogenase family protein [Verrucomicrobiota bacterium]
MRWRKVTLIGVGLLGGSLGLALRQLRLADQVWGYVRRRESVDECIRCEVVDHCTNDLKESVTGSDLVVFCTPISQMAPLGKELAPFLSPGTIVTDVGSVKHSVVQELTPIIAKGGGIFVGSHPMAGSEKMGVAAARADLFTNSICVVTETENQPEATARVRQLWESVGARTVQMSSQQHDEFVSRTSHLPHLVAAQLAHYVLAPTHPAEQSLLCANGFRDTTRIASGSPEMWRDISVANRKQLSIELGIFINELSQLREALDQMDTGAIQKFFDTAKQRRDAWCARMASPSPE